MYRKIRIHTNIYFIISYLYCIVITAACVEQACGGHMEDRYEKQFSFFVCLYVFGELYVCTFVCEWSKNMNNVSFLLPLFCINGDFMCFSCMMLLHIYHCYMCCYSCGQNNKFIYFFFAK